jgi:predicted GIY-YIG superfamily endonuclease
MVAEVIRDNALYQIEVDGVVRYVGRTNKPEQRLHQHLRDSRRYKHLFARKLRSAHDRGLSITLVVLASGMTRQEAGAAEVALIAKLGGHQERGRQLWNTHSGGLGGASLASSEALKKKWASDEQFRAGMAARAREQISNQRSSGPAFEQSRLKGIRAYRTSEDGLKKLAEARNKIDRAKQVAAVRAALKRQWEDPDYREKMAAAKKAAYLRRRGARV